MTTAPTTRSAPAVLSNTALATYTDLTECILRLAEAEQLLDNVRASDNVSDTDADRLRWAIDLCWTLSCRLREAREKMVAS